MPRLSRLEEYLDKLKKYYHKKWGIPNFETLTKLFWVSSKGSIHKIFNKFIDMWLLEKKWKKINPTKKFLWLPIFESVRAWNPTDQTDENADVLDIHSHLIDNPLDTVLIKVKWDSMINAGIVEWDIVIVDKTRKWREWEIVVAIVDNQYTLKYLLKDKDNKYFLKAGNPNYSDIYARNELEIFGVVKWSFRKY